MQDTTGIIERKQVTEIGTGAHVYVPKEWRDDYVKVVRLTDDEETDE